MALLKGFLLDCSGVALRSSAASSRESMLRELSDIPQAEPCRSTDNGVAATKAIMYFSCSNVDVVSEDVAKISPTILLYIEGLNDEEDL